MSRSIDLKLRRLATVVALVCLLAPLSARSVTAGERDAMNIILILADDLGYMDLPFFNPPIHWENDTPPALPANGCLPVCGPGCDPESQCNKKQSNRNGYLKRLTAEYLRRVPDLNRSAARILADYQTGEPGVDAEEHVVLSYDPLSPTTTLPPSTTTTLPPQPPHYRQSPGCTNADSANFEAKGEIVNCTYRDDALEGFGGLGRLAKEGVVFRRFYSTSARCAPTRASLMTGRHNRRAGVTDNGDELSSDEITIAEFLKQGCRSNETGSTEEDLWCSDGGNSTAVRCPCFVDETAGHCSSFDTTNCICDQRETDQYDERIACYTTGLLGKWHLGGGDGKAPWFRGFDEVFGFGGGSRHFWAGNPLKCSKPWLYLGPDPDSVDSCGGGCDGDPATSCSSTELDYDCCDEQGTYELGSYDRDKPSRTSPSMPCTDDGEVTDTLCQYSTRIYRDRALDYIERHSDDRNPFFLFLSLHAPHLAHVAPERTKRHYYAKNLKNPSGDAEEKRFERHQVKYPKPNRPRGSGGAYWAILEEMDAAVGQILAKLDYEKACAADSGNAFRTRCTDNASLCGTGTCEPLANQTVIIFTSDHGSPGGNSWGSPVLSGGKQTVLEGGIRTGLLIRAPGLDDDGTKRCSGDWSVSCDDDGGCSSAGGFCRTITVIDRHLDGDRVGSGVDLFATIADFAGYGGTEQGAPLDPDTGVLERLLPDATGTRRIDGRSLRTVLTGASTGRDFVFATYTGQGDTIVARSGVTLGASETEAASVCGVSNVRHYGGNSAAGIERTFRAASSIRCDTTTVDDSCKSVASCTNNSDCDDFEGEEFDGECWTADGVCLYPCYSLGKVCVPEDEDPESATAPENVCSTDSSRPGYKLTKDNASCPAEEWKRCKSDSDCKLPASSEEVQTFKCMRVRVACTDCLPASWKARVSATEGTFDVATLYDLTTNPEEDDQFNFQGIGEVSQIETDLQGRLHAWHNCTTSTNADCDAADCEGATPGLSACYQ